MTHHKVHVHTGHDLKLRFWLDTIYRFIAQVLVLCVTTINLNLIKFTARKSYFLCRRETAPTVSTTVYGSKENMNSVRVRQSRSCQKHLHASKTATCQLFMPPISRAPSVTIVFQHKLTKFSYVNGF